MPHVGSHELMSMLAIAARLDAAASGLVTTQAPLQVDGAGYEYNMELPIGTPPQKAAGNGRHTISNLSFIKCGAYSNCTPEGPSYYPAGTSTSFSMRPGLLRPSLRVTITTCGAGGAECEYIYGYALEGDPEFPKSTPGACSATRPSRSATTPSWVAKACRPSASAAPPGPWESILRKLRHLRARPRSTVRRCVAA